MGTAVKSKSHGTPAHLDYRRPIQAVRTLLVNPAWAHAVASLVSFGETFLCIAIIRLVAFTNIDWKAYMEQVQTVLAGERDYLMIKGDTGPLVYPAGHVWAYGALHYLTDAGKHVRTGQYIFAGVYLATQAIVFRLYRFDGKIPPYAYCILAISKRLHSIYLLRCFNDGIAMFFLYASVWAACTKRWTGASILFSLALSIKMSILLFAPAFAYLVVVATGLNASLFHAAEVVAVQLALAQPFLSYSWRSYASRAFEFSRVFLYEWTVNWRFLSEEAFLSKPFSFSLLAGHATVLVLAAMYWSRRFGGLSKIMTKLLRHPDKPVALLPKQLTPKFIITVFFSCNLIGMLFARSLHYQFYAWEAHQLVFLAWQTSWPPVVKLAILAGFEVGWETFPSTSSSSLALVISHGVLVLSVLSQTDWVAV